MTDVWFVQRGDDRWGPLTKSEFDALSATGHLRGGDWIWTNSWLAWRAYEDLQPRAAAQPPPLPRLDTVSIDSRHGPELLSVQDALARLVNEHLQEIGIDPAHSAEYQYTQIFHELLVGVGGGKSWTEDSLRCEIGRAHELLSELTRAFEGNHVDWGHQRTGGARYLKLWQHRDLRRAFNEGFGSEHACPLERESLARIPPKYLAQDMRSPTFEALLLDALVATEIYYFGEELKENPSRYVKKSIWSNSIERSIQEMTAYRETKGRLDQLNWRWLRLRFKRNIMRFAIVYVAPIGIILAAGSQGWGSLAVVVLTVFAFFLGYRLVSWVWRKIRGLFRDQPAEPLERALELHQKMILAYDHLQGGTSVSPRRAREVLAKVADEGAAWDPGVFALLDAACARSTGGWG